MQCHIDGKPSRRHKWETKSDIDGKYKVIRTGNFPGDTDGKSESDADGKCFSPGKQGLREHLFSPSLNNFSGDKLGN